MTREVKNHTAARFCSIVAVVAAACIAGSAPVASGQIEWRSGPAEVARLDGAELAAAITQLADRPEARHVVVQFDRPIGAAQRAELRQAGLDVLRSLGEQAFFAVLSETGPDATRLSAMPFMQGVQGIERAWKLDPRVLAGEVPDWAMVKEDAQVGTIVGVYVVFHPDVPLLREATAAVEGHGGQIRSVLESINGLVVELPLADLEALADEDAVQWIEWPLPPMSEVNDSNREITEANIVHASPYNLDGSGISVLVYDGGTGRATHLDFEGRLTVRDSSGMNNHSTHVAGTVGGAGVANSAYKGMAPGVIIESYGFQVEGGLQPGFLYTDPGDLEDDYNEAINTYGVDISNNSIGSNVESNGYDCTWQGDYGATAALIDAIVGGSLGAPFRVVWANGNERQGSRCDVEGYGDYYSIAPPSGAKNHITVGALNSNDDSMTYFSSWGPTDDGRLKPDISGPGCQSGGDGGVTSCSSGGDTSYTTMCGTSMASPTVCGLSALLLEDFRAQFPGDPDPRNSTLKILLAHSAVDLGNTGPDYQYGYGSVRIQQSIDFMRTENFLETQVDQGGTFSVLVSVDPGDPELKVTVAWDDVPGTPNVNPALVNDLDLRVFDPSSQQYYPWTLDQYNPSNPAVQTQADHLNNIEQVLVNSPTAGVWRVEVYGYNVPQGPQTFSLCASPELVACSSQGTIALDAPKYGCSDTAGIQVVDCDLNADGGTIETVTVTIASDSEPGGETVLLTETGPETADFRGSIPLDTTNSSGVLLVADGDTVTATYIDADDGQGGTNVPVIATATVDCTGPVISNVQVAEIGSDNATVTFDTDERATGTVRYGLSCGALTESVTESSAGTSHTLVLTGLTDGAQYYFAVDAVDEQGNPSTDDNGGSCYSFSTPDVVYSFSMDTDPGWTTEGLWAWGQPTGGGGQYGNPDPTSGYTGSNVYGYNLNGDYENSLAETHLTSTALDCTGLSYVTLKFWRWLGVEQPVYDHAYVRVSNNGSTWTTIWENTAEVTDSSWTLQEFDISAVADNQATVYLRWTMGPTDSAWQYCGWNIDDVQIVALGGGGPTCDDGIQNQGEDKIDCGGPCPPCNCLLDGDCADGLFCNGTETCDAYGECQAGSDPCPGQLCDEDNDRCVDCFVDADCDDGLYCNGAETCFDGECQPGTAVDCDDGVDCTDDSCNEGTDSCDNVPNDANCDNGLYCDGAETCHATLDCQAGTAVDCNDEIDCTADSCNEGTDSCDNIPDDGYCDDGLFCNGAETCDAQDDCQPGTDPCPGQYCDEGADSCYDCEYDSECDDGLFCNGAETCVGGFCQAGTNPCQPDQFCNEETDTCEDVECLVDEDCDDGSDCTVDTCVAGVCYNECPSTVSSYPYAEGFESGWGDWVNVSGDDMDWTRRSGSTPSSSTGPSGAHGGSYYVYTESSSPNYPNKTAILEGPCFDLTNTGDAALTFWYHMYGSAMGTLNVEASEDCINWTNVWSLSGNQGNAWYEANVDLTSYCGSTIVIRFRGVTGSSYTSDMSIDDLSVTVTPAIPCDDDGDCADGLFCNGAETCVDHFCQPGTDPCPLQGCDEVNDVCVPCTGDEDCDDGNACTVDTCVGGVCYNECPSTVLAYPYAEGFESGWGDWVNASGDDMDWTRRSGSTPSSSTGPSGAHGGSYYVYTESSSPNYPNKTAILEGPCFDLSNTSDAALTFWYHMYGSAMGTLNVEVSEDCVAWTNVWTLSGNQGNAWYEANVDLTSYSGTMIVIRFRGVTGSSYTSDMSVDDISVTATVGPECDYDWECDDGLYCNGAETCVDHTCQPGTAVTCDDGVACTDDSCNEATDSCDYVPNDANCANGLYCDGTETCHATLGCQPGTAVDCDDGVNCTIDSCNEGTDSCDNIPDDAYCDDGLFCNGAETCDTGLGCLPGSDPCPGQYCDEDADTCYDCEYDWECDDGLYCNGAETCVGGFCQAGADPCPGQGCDEDNDQCVPLPEMYTPGEYDLNEGMLIRWGSYTSVLTDMTVGVTTGDPDAIVYIVVTGASQQASATSTLTAAGADMSQVDFITYTTNTGWIRDYGPRFIINDVAREIVDFEYNRPRPADNAFPAFLGNLWGEPVSEMPLTHGGGNLHVAGGDAFMTELVLDENPGLTAQDVADLIEQYHNLDLTIYDRFPSSYDPTGHIDMWMLPVSDSAVIVGEYPSSSGDPYTITEAAAADLTARGYTVYRTPGWNTLGTHYTYTNATIMNDVVLVPSYGIGEDATALAVFQTAFPDRTMVQVDCTSIVSAGGATHCIMMHVPAVPCLDDNDCDDGLFCNGAETCVGGVCQPGTDPCPGQACDEENDQCVPEPTAQLESGSVTVGGSPVTVNLTNTYFSPVVVCSIQYNNNSIPVVARVTDVTSTSFDVYVQNPSGGGVSAENVSYLVVEEGTWTIDGVNLEAQTYLSTVTDENNSWIGEAQSYGQSYTNPVVLGQVMSDNDPAWSVFWCQGSSRTNPPSSSALVTGKTVCEDTDTTRADETIGFIVFEAGHGTIGGVEFEALLGADSVQGVADSPPYTYAFSTPFAYAPTVAVTTMAGVDGGNGGWSYSYGSTLATTTTLYLAVDEDQIGDTERNHTAEQVGYVAFGTPLVYSGEVGVVVTEDEGKVNRWGTR